MNYVPFVNVEDVPTMMINCSLLLLEHYGCQSIMTGLVVSHDCVNIMVGGLIPSQLARVYHGCTKCFSALSLVQSCLA